MAAGLSLDRGNLVEFEQALAEAVNLQLDGAVLTEEILTDGELGGDDFNLDTALEIERFGPWGQRFPEPLFDGRFDVVDSRIVGSSHLKMIVKPSGGGPEIDAIAFNRLPENLPKTGSARFLYRLGINRFRGAESPQLVVEHIIL